MVDVLVNRTDKSDHMKQQEQEKAACTKRVPPFSCWRAHGAHCAQAGAAPGVPIDVQVGLAEKKKKCYFDSNIDGRRTRLWLS